VISVTTLYVIRDYLKITGFATYRYNLTNVPRQGWEPLGAEPEGNFLNYIGFDGANDRYFLGYSGNDMPLVYYIYPNLDPWEKTAIFRSIWAETNYKGDSYSFQPSLGGIKVRLNGVTYNVWDTGINKQLKNSQISNSNIILTYNLSKNNDYVLVTASYTIKGKTLIMDLTADQNKIEGVYIYRTGGQSPDEYVTDELGYTGFLKYAIRKKNIFYKMYNDPSKSSATTLEYYTAAKVLPTRVDTASYAYYKNNTLKQLPPLQERLYLTVSQNFLELFPSVPNNPSNYRTYLSDRIILDFWNYGQRFNSYYDYAKKLYNYGFRDLHVIIDAWGKTPWPEFIPPNSGMGGETELKSVLYKLKSIGFNTALYTIWQDMYAGSIYYTSEYYMKDENNQRMQGWSNSAPLKYDKRLGIAQSQVPTIHSYGTVGEFTDTVGVNGPWYYVDRDANSPINAQYKNNVPYEAELMNYLRTTEQGPIFTEGGGPIFSIGILDSVEGTQICCQDDYKNPVVVDYDLKYIRPKMLTYGGYWRRFMPNANNDVKYKGITESNIDKYTTTHIAFGHIGFIDSTAPWMHNVSDKLVIRYYYLMKELQKEYALEDAVEIRYYVSGQWLDVSDAMRAAYDFVNAQVRVKYANGLVVYANRHDNTNLNVDYEGKTYLIPPSGFFAYNPNDGFFEFSGLQNGKRVDISENGVYTYLDPRNNGEMNFTLHDNNYYLAQRFNIGTGLQNITYTFTIMDKTIITTSEPLRLTRLPMTGNMVKVTMNSATGSQTTTNLLETKSILVDSSKFGIKIDGSAYTSGAITGIKQVEIDKNNDPALKFNYDFSQGVLNLNALDIQEVSGYIIVKNLNINNKTIYLDRASNASRVCIEDADINTIADISSSCKGANEVLVACPGTNGRYSCNIVGNKYEVSGLTHSGAMEYGCSLHWNCSGWSGCYNDSQARTCGCGCYFDSECTGEYALQQSCTCSLPWSCNEWSSCVNEMQVRTCTCGCGIDSECTGDHSAQQACACSMPWNCSEWSSCSNGTQTRDCICDCEISSDCHGNNTIEQNCTMPPVTEQPSPPPSGGGGGGIIIPPIITNNTPVVNQTTNLSSNNTINPPVQNQTINYTQPPKNLTNTTKAAGKVTAPGQIRKKLSTFTARLVQNMAQIALDATTLTFIAALFIMTMAALIMHRKSRIMHPKYSQGTEQMRAYQQQLIHMRPREQHYQELAGYIQKSRDAGVEEQVIIKKLSGAGWKADVIKEYMKK